MKKSILFIFMVILGMMVISFPAHARFDMREGGFGKGGIGIPPGKWWKTARVKEALPLTKEEIEKMDVMYLEHRRKMIDLRGEMAKERLEIEYLLDTSPFDATASMERFKKLQEAKRKMAFTRFGFLVKIRELLGLERFQKLKEEFRRYKTKRKQGKSRGRRDKTPAG
jgi:hypothetical protein